MITVHDRDLCQELLGFGFEQLDSSNKLPEDRKTKSRVKRASNQSPDSLIRSNTHSQIIRAQEWLSRKARRTIIAVPTDSDVQAVEALCSTLESERKELFEEIDIYLASQTRHRQCKREMLYQKWKDEVFIPLSSSITSTLNSTYSFNDRQRRQLFDQFLCLQYKKGVFLDTITITEYNPLRLSYIAAKAETPSLNDPLLSQERDHLNELVVMRNCDIGVPPDKSHDVDITPHGRSDTDPLLWLAMKLVQINSDQRLCSRQRVKDLQSSSHFINGSTVIKDTNNQDEPHLPHKIPINYPREKLSLEWNKIDTSLF